MTRQGKAVALALWWLKPRPELVDKDMEKQERIKLHQWLDDRDAVAEAMFDSLRERSAFLDLATQGEK